MELASKQCRVEGIFAIIIARMVSKYHGVVLTAKFINKIGLFLRKMTVRTNDYGYLPIRNRGYACNRSNTLDDPARRQFLASKITTVHRFKIYMDWSATMPEKF